MTQSNQGGLQHTRQLEDGYGFDAVIGNPPYGALFSSIEKSYLKKKYSTSNTDSAALFIIKQLSILKSKSFGGFIVPKPMTYSSKWITIREAIRNGLDKLIDVSKVWKDVKLEQVVYILKNDDYREFYKSYIRDGIIIRPIGQIEKDNIDRFGFFLNGVGDKEIHLAHKILGNKIYLSNFVTNRRGAMLQKSLSEKGDLIVFGGRNIMRYGFTYKKSSRISKKYTDIEQAFISKDSILAQNIVAHIMNPIDHIKIIATILDKRNVVILDTINQLKNISNLDSQYLLGILCSKLINWYVYRFIYAKAIRTMHFDGPVTNRIPYKDINMDNTDDKAKHDKMVQLVDTMLKLNRQLADSRSAHEKKLIDRQIESTDRKIDELVYDLYDLTPEEIQIVEDSFKK